MKEILQQLSAYHAWANALLIDLMNGLPEEKHKTDVPSSFRNLYLTLLHMWDAESVWWQRMKLQERIVLPSDTFSGSLKEMGQQFLAQNRQWIEWIGSATEPQLQHEFIYYNRKREKFKQPVFQVALHVFNHGTYHRGQLVNMLRQLNVNKIPQTDFTVWSRKR